ncbi:VPS37B subunit of ESCRT-I a [Lepisosteus oculatus]|uniref:VPS37B subunit of ESCRT-I a n=1 Tax=Lepisosteus oculatus TaxID=7918 RepID=UPI0035F5086A
MSGFGNKLSSFSISQLNELLEDDEKLNKMIQEMDEVQDVQHMKETTLASNRSLAEQNLMHQPKLECLKMQLTKKYQELQDCFEAHQMKTSKLDNRAGSGSIDTLLALLQAEGAKIEEETENMADSFLEGESALDVFVDEYQSKRKLAHLRRVKIDKLREMVLKGHRLPQAPVKLPRLPETRAAAAAPESTPPTFAVDTSTPPAPLPRRVPPLPPVQPVPASVASSTPQAAPLPYPASPYPPIPPRAGHALPTPNLQPGYPNAYIPPYGPPPIPQRPPPHLAPQPGFIMQ